jgi:hypothetical protein
MQIQPRTHPSNMTCQIPAFDAAVLDLHLIIMTIEEGHNGGKTYVLRIPSHDASTWSGSGSRG